MKKIIYIAIAVMASVLLLCGCSEADRANSNISKQADYFESERKITVYNARTDKVIMEAEGYMSISNNSSNELVCTVMRVRALSCIAALPMVCSASQKRRDTT